MWLTARTCSAGMWCRWMVTGCWYEPRIRPGSTLTWLLKGYVSTRSARTVGPSNRSSSRPKPEHDRRRTDQDAAPAAYLADHWHAHRAAHPGRPAARDH